MLQAKKVLAILTLGLLVISGFVASTFATAPENLPNLTDQTDSEMTTIDVGNGTTIDMLVEGDNTTLFFEDGSTIKVISSEVRPSVEIHEDPSSPVFTRIYVDHSLPVPLTPIGFDTFSDFQMPETAPGVVIQEVDSSSGQDVVQTELMEMSLTSSDPVSVPTGFIHQERDFAGTGPIYSHFISLQNSTDTEFQFYRGEDPVTNPSNPHGVTLLGSRERAADHLGNFNFQISDTTHPEVVNANLVVYNNETDPSYNSFFDAYFGLFFPDGRVQTHDVQGQLDPGMGPVSQATYTNDTDGRVNTPLYYEGGAPVSARYADPGSDPFIPFEVLDLTVSPESISLSFGYYEFMLYLDKFVINYFAGDGIYIPIVIYFVTLEVVIIYEFITIIIYLEIIELVTVIIIYEIIKIEVYITYIVMIIEIINIVILEIVIYIIDITIILVQINITINIFVITIKIIINIIQLIFILPIWIIIVPIPIFIPVFVPVFIPVPTPVPYVPASTDVDLYDQKLNETADTIDLAYMVTNEYDQPITGATVDVTVDNGTVTTYTATEDPNIPGLYNVTVPYDATASYYIEAFPQYRPKGDLYYEQEDVPVAPTSTVTVPTTVTSNVTTTVTVNQNGSTIASGVNPLPLSPMAVFIGLLASFMVTMVVRRKET